MPIRWILLLPFLAAAQPPMGTLQVTLTPKAIKVGDSVWFTAGLYSPGLCPFRSSYTIEKAAEPDSFRVKVKSEPTGGDCAAAYGFSGPQFHIRGPHPGHYEVAFDSASTFKADMGDSATFLA